jgi:hypothetical protein
MTSDNEKITEVETTLDGLKCHWSKEVVSGIPPCTNAPIAKLTYKTSNYQVYACRNCLDRTIEDITGNWIKIEYL